ncbi:hypothetical protein [Alkalihalobacillus pseudalcaliphilus]|uniref:hypothetical protein n=1 Tax=Alkalihalobacillus pseudalcaliphilus TaxID=79884 RepID=UPI00064D7C94|nr:hypothetical protein [Alkalihalobacillus pseudalcaliphilus]KMK76701.1 hypothetical protein AB990_14440 [Alkalihalobacillus pseudalcaliphilus]
MKELTDSPWFKFLTPAHRRAVDEHLLRDEATNKLIKSAEKLIDHLTKKAPGYNQKRSIRRKQKDMIIRLKVNHKWIRLQIADTKYSVSPVQKRINIVCYRHYVKANNGIGVCKEATIHYYKDGKWHVRSIKQSPSFQGVFFRVHRLDEAFSTGAPQTETSLEWLSKQREQLRSSTTDQLPYLLEESKRYFDSVNQFSIDPLIQNRLERLVEQASKISTDFDLLDYEEKHIVKRMFKEDIPKLLNTYLSLSLKNQLDQKENIFVTLSKMELTLLDYQNQLEKARVEKMNYLLKLQEIRYNRKQL